MPDFITSIAIQAENQTTGPFTEAAGSAEAYARAVSAAEQIGASAAEQSAGVFEETTGRQIAAEAARVASVHETAAHVSAAEEAMSRAVEANAERIEAQNERLVESFKVVGEAALGAVQGGGAASLMRGFGEMAGAAIIGEMLEHVVDKTKEDVIETSHLAEASGIAADKITELKDAMAVSGAPTENLNQAVTRLARAMQAARDPSSQQAEAFRELGISTAGWAEKLPPAIDVLEAIGKHLADSKNNIQDTANVSELFGRNVVGLTGFLKAHGDELQVVMERYKSHGEAVKAAVGPAEDLNRAEKELDISWQTLEAGALPAVTWGIQNFNIGMVKLGAEIANVVDLGETGFSVIASKVVAAGEAVKLGFTGHIKEAEALLNTTAAATEATWAATVARIDARTAEALKREYDLTFPQPKKEASGDTDVDYADNKHGKRDVQRDAQLAEISAHEKNALAHLAIEKDKIEQEEKLDNLSASRAAELLETNAQRELAIKQSAIAQKIALLANDPDSVAKVAELQGQRVEAENAAARQVQAIRAKAVESHQKDVERANELWISTDRKTEEQIKKSAEAGAKAIQKIDADTTRATEEFYRQQLRASEITEQGRIAHAQRIGQMVTAEIEHEAAIDEISQRKKIELLKEQAEAERAVQMAAAQSKLGDATASGKQGDIASAQAEIQKIEDSYTRTMSKLKQESNDLLFAPLKTGFEATANAFNGMILGMIGGHEKFSKAVLKATQDVEKAVLQSILRQGEKEVEKKLRELAMHVFVTHAESEADAEAKAQHAAQAAAVIGTNSLEATSDMGLAAAAAAAEAAPAGPEAAIAAGAAMMAAMSPYVAMASAAGGWDLPAFSGGAPAILHGKEMVLPAPLAEGVRRMTAEGGGSGSTRDSHDVHYHGVRGESPHTIRSNTEALQRAVRDGRLRAR